MSSRVKYINITLSPPSPSLSPSSYHALHYLLFIFISFLFYYYSPLSREKNAAKLFNLLFFSLLRGEIRVTSNLYVFTWKSYSVSGFWLTISQILAGMIGENLVYFWAIVREFGAAISAFIYWLLQLNAGHAVFVIR